MTTVFTNLICSFWIYLGHEVTYYRRDGILRDLSTVKLRFFHTAAFCWNRGLGFLFVLCIGIIPFLYEICVCDFSFINYSLHS